MSHASSQSDIIPDSTSITTNDAAPPPVRRVLVFVIIALALMMMAVDSTIVATVLHALQGELHAPVNWAAWTITGYSFGFVLMLPVSGALSEQYGCKRIFIGSVLLFTLASLCCGFATNIYMLVVLRVLQAIGGAGFMPSATRIVVDYFSDERDRAVSFFGSIFPIGAMIGPIFGGLFVTYWTWRGIFWVNVPIGLAVAALAWHYIPRDPVRSTTDGSRHRQDYAGIALLACGLLAGMLAASHAGSGMHGIASFTFAILCVIAVLSLRGFFRHLARVRHPLIAPHLIRGRGFSTVNLINALYGGIPSAVITLLPLYAINRYGLGALAAGTLLIAQGIATTLLSTLAALRIRHTGYRGPLYVGGVIIPLGVALLALGPMGGLSPYVWLAAAAALVGAGRGALNPASRNAGLQLEPEHASTLAALRTMGAQSGAIAAISIATAIMASAGNAGMAQSWIYLVAALMLVVALPLIAHVPEHRGAW